MNGGRDETVLVLIDGVPASAGDWGGLIATPGVDSVNEAQIVRNTYEAQFGKTGGGVINLTSKGGSQDYHGTLFEYHRNDELDANSWFNNKFNRPKSEFKRNQYGGNIGGPIW
jgi:outer membrane cobalamin receptor